jgi:hypothetical protein
LGTEPDSFVGEDVGLEVTPRGLVTVEVVFVPVTTLGLVVSTFQYKLLIHDLLTLVTYFLCRRRCNLRRRFWSGHAINKRKRLQKWKKENTKKSNPFALWMEKKKTQEITI